MNFNEQQSGTVCLANTLLNRMVNEAFPSRDNQDFSIIVDNYGDDLMIATWVTIDGQQFVVRRKCTSKPTTARLFWGCHEQVSALASSVRDHLTVDVDSMREVALRDGIREPDDGFDDDEWPNDPAFLVDDDFVCHGVSLDDYDDARIWECDESYRDEDLPEGWENENIP